MAKKQKAPTETVFTIIDGKHYGAIEYPRPMSRRFRGAWVVKDNPKRIEVDFEKAKAMVAELVGAEAVAKAKTVADLDAIMDGVET